MPVNKVSLAIAQVSVANAARDGTGTLATLVTADPYGTKVLSVQIVGTGTTTAGVIRFFISDGLTTRLAGEVLVTAITPGVSTPVFSTTWNPPAPGGAVFGGSSGLVIPGGSTLKASTHNAEVFNLIAAIEAM